MYELAFEDEWESRFDRLDKSVQIRVWKKVLQIKAGLPGRHLGKGAGYFVEEVGQYRIAYKSFDETNVRKFYFVGTHKEYMKWLGLEKA